MSAIIRHIVDMSPYMLLALPIYLFLRVIYLKKINHPHNWYREAALLVFVVFTVGLASQAIFPEIEVGKDGLRFVTEGTHTTNLIPFHVVVMTCEEVFVNGNLNALIINFLGNIVMFMPFGFFAPLLWNVSDRVAVLFGFAASLTIEVSQLFLPRSTDVDDLILNTFGALLGLLLYKIASRYINKFIIKFKSRA